MLQAQQRIMASLLISALALVIPFAGHFERIASATWTSRLGLPSFLEETPRHTSLFSTGEYLPPEITRDLILTPQMGPLLVAGRTRVAPGATLTLQPGTKLYFSEFATLSIEGALSIKGSAGAPVELLSNEQHPLNQIWGGVIFMPGSRGEIQQAHIAQAAPGISCLPQSRVTVTSTKIEAVSVGVYGASAQCRFIKSTVRSTGYGVVAVDRAPEFIETKILSARELVHTTVTETK